MKTFKKYLAAIVSLCMIAAAWPGMTYASTAEYDNTDAACELEAAETVPGDTAAWNEEMAKTTAEAAAETTEETAAETTEETAAETTEETAAVTAEEPADAPAEELVGDKTIHVGGSVIARLNSNNGHVTLYNGTGETTVYKDVTLPRDWIEKSGFGADNIRSISVDVSSGVVCLPEDSTEIFADCKNLTGVLLSGFHTSNAKNLTRMFYHCESLTSIDLSGFDSSNVESMIQLFDGCSSLTSLDLDGFITGKTQSMYRMFADCGKLKTITFGKVDTSNVHGLHGTFSSCTSLTSLDLSSFNTSNMDSLFSAFSGCSSLTSVNLSGWNTSKVDRMDRMFSGCESLQYVDLTHFDTSKINAAEFMFNNCSSFVELDLSSFDLSNLSYTPDYMFYGCTGLSILKTPKKNTDGDIDLPQTMYDSTGKAYSKLPVLAKSIVLGVTAKAAKDYEEVHVSGGMPVKKLKDVLDPTHPYYKAIYWAVKRGITKGYSDGTFGIDKPCTRGHAVMFLWRMGGSPAPKSVPKSPFSDVPTTHTFYKAILWAQQKGITKGYTRGALKGKFGVDETCTRGQIMTFIWRFKGTPAPKSTLESPFSDVPTTHAYYKAILWGSQNKITNGYTSGPKKGMFGLNDSCTRGMIVKFLYNIR